MNNSVFLTYNPESELERTLALRLHTIGAVNGFQMYLPDRMNGIARLDQETKYRIQHSTWFIIFSTTRLSSIVLEEIRFALSVKSDPARVIIIYDDSREGKNLTGVEGCTEVHFDSLREPFDRAAGRIVEKMWTDAYMSENSRVSDQVTSTQQRRGLAALIGIGIGLLALSTLSGDTADEEEKPKASRSAKKTKKKSSEKVTARKKSGPKKGGKRSKTSSKSRK